MESEYTSEPSSAGTPKRGRFHWVQVPGFAAAPFVAGFLTEVPPVVPLIPVALVSVICLLDDVRLLEGTTGRERSPRLLFLRVVGLVVAVDAASITRDVGWTGIYLTVWVVTELSPTATALEAVFDRVALLVLGSATQAQALVKRGRPWFWLVVATSLVLLFLSAATSNGGSVTVVATDERGTARPRAEVVPAAPNLGIPAPPECRVGDPVFPKP